MEQDPAKDAGAGTWARAVFAVTLFVEDLAATKQYYMKVFDLPVVFEDDNSAIFKFGELVINLLTTSAALGLIAPRRVASPEAGSRVVFTIHVEDVDALCATLAARGVELLNGPMDRPWGIRTASFVDPGGHVWEIAR
jgi:predicted enzyme related to lactoylglutathione lyase